MPSYFRVTDSIRIHSEVKSGIKSFFAPVLMMLAAVLFVSNPASAKGKAGLAAPRIEKTLDGSDWLLGSFAMNEGVRTGANSETFDEHDFRKVEVPGEVQLQLGLKGQDLFRQTKELTSINEKEWWYRKHFRATPPEAGKRVLLQFDGADYFASVWLNGTLLGDHEGTFVPFSFDVTRLLRYDRDNTLAIRVTHPWIPNDRGLGEYMNGNFTLSVYSDTLTLSHPPYVISAGWDGLPAHGNATFAMGLFRSVRLVTLNALTLADVYARTVSIDPDGSALVDLGGEVENAGKEASKVSIALKAAPSNFTGPALDPISIDLDAAPGRTPFHTQVRVKDAHLWWSWDSGAQNLYKLDAQLLPRTPSSAKPASAPLDLQSIHFGIRTVKRDADMTYTLNGKRLFIKASWFPIEDYFASRSTKASYDRDLRLFRDANLNTLVNFTVVEKPAFYDLCDELGLLIVVEMPFPQFGPGGALNADSPRRKPFLAESRKEIDQIMRELRTHPAIIEWAPLAESHDANGGWGFDGYKFDQSGYQEFMDSMRDLVTGLAPDAIFHPSLCDLGEKHFWLATAGYRGDSGEYQQQYDASAGFISEYGGISMSSYEKLGDYLTRKEQWDPQNHSGPRWFNLPIDLSAYSYLASSEYDSLYSMLYRAENYVDRDISSPRDLVDDTQTYQAFILKYATEAYRRKKYEPIKGIRFWDFLEIGPGFRFGIVDLDRIPKISYWWMKRAEAPLAVNFAYKNALEPLPAGSSLAIPVWAINDLDRAVDATVRCSIADLKGKELFHRSFTGAVAKDGKAQMGVVDWTLPDVPGVYLVRATLTSSNPDDHAEDTTFVKVAPRVFARPLRVLLIGQATSAAPIAGMLRTAGVRVDVRDEESIGRFGDLADGAAVHSQYDAIWLANFENFAKIFPASAAEGLKNAVAAGTGFIHTGGESSYHGGQSRQSLVEITPLADVLPVQIQTRNDLVYGEHSLDDSLQTENGLHEISATPGADVPAFKLLQHYGIKALNLVTPRTGSQTLISANDMPLLVTGQFGQGRTVSFTGFTPKHPKNDEYLIGQAMIRDPVNRSYFETWLSLIALATGEKPVLSPAAALDAVEKPLFQTLKEQPLTTISAQLGPRMEGAADCGLAGKRSVTIINGASYAHLVRLRAEWDPATQPYLTEWSDNAFELLPGEQKTITLSWRSASSSPASGALVIDGSNLALTRVPLN